MVSCFSRWSSSSVDWDRASGSADVAERGEELSVGRHLDDRLHRCRLIRVAPRFSPRRHWMTRKSAAAEIRNQKMIAQRRERRTISESESLRGREEGPFSTIQIFDRSITKRSPTVGIFYPHLEPFHLWLKWKPRKFSSPSLCQKPLTALAGRRDEALIADPIRAECGREEGRFCCPITPEINVPIVIQERERRR